MVQGCQQLRKTEVHADHKAVAKTKSLDTSKLPAETIQYLIHTLVAKSRPALLSSLLEGADGLTVATCLIALFSSPDPLSRNAPTTCREAPSRLQPAIEPAIVAYFLYMGQPRSCMPCTAPQKHIEDYSNAAMCRNKYSTTLPLQTCLHMKWADS